MTPTHTPTSDAEIRRYKIGYHADEWGQRSSTPSGIPDASGSWVRYADHVTALAAGQATAAQPGVVYAELPVPNYPKSGGFPGTFAEAQMHAFADATHTLRAPHGQAPAKPDPAYSEACNLATALYKKHFAHRPDFASGQAVWSLCDSTAGVISQIDNMVAGLVRPPTTAFSEDEL